MKSVRLFLAFICLLLSHMPSIVVHAGVESEAWNTIEQKKEFFWGGDASGGAPYVFPDPSDPNKLIGFEVDLMEAIGEDLQLRPIFVNVPWDQLVPALLRGDFQVVFNGLEITEDRQETIDFTVPYYYFAEQITTHIKNPKTINRHFSSLKELKGLRVGTLSASLAQSMMEKEGGITVVPYPSPVESYRDLEIGRIEAVLLDLPIAAWYAYSNNQFVNHQSLIGLGIYAGAVRKSSPLLRVKLNESLNRLINNGKLEKIYRKWNMWNELQFKLKESASQDETKGRAKTGLQKFIPVILEGALMTVGLSIISMAFAVTLGMWLCLGKLYSRPLIRTICTSYIEIVRGTPLLIQLYLLYYGLPNLGIELNAIAAAILGLGLNYAAYEAEIYRAGILNVPKGQDEAAISLGLTGAQSLRYVIIPQAFSSILPPSTNDFIALFKDTSLVSVITVMELTRSYNQAANTTYRFLELGLFTAFLYFAMSFPLSLWSRKIEQKEVKKKY